MGLKYEIYFLNNSFSTQGRLNESKSHTTHTRQEIKLTCFRLRSPMHLKFGLYVGYTQWGVHRTH